MNISTQLFIYKFIFTVCFDGSARSKKFSVMEDNYLTEENNSFNCSSGKKAPFCPFLHVLKFVILKPSHIYYVLYSFSGKINRGTEVLVIIWIWMANLWSMLRN